MHFWSKHKMPVVLFVRNEQGRMARCIGHGIINWFIIPKMARNNKDLNVPTILSKPETNNPVVYIPTTARSHL